MGTNYYVFLEDPELKIRNKIKGVLDLANDRMAVRELRRQIDDLLDQFKAATQTAKPLHIGKSSAGWQFSFHGYTKERSPDCPVELKSFQDWKRFLTETPGLRIETEYGETIAVEEFLERASYQGLWGDGRPLMTRERWAQSEEGRRYGTWAPSARDWTDAEGFNFSECDFS